MCFICSTGAVSLNWRGPRKEDDEVLVQEQAGEPGLLGDRPATFDVRLGKVLHHPGSNQAAPAVRLLRNLPRFAVITSGKVHDVTVAKILKLQPGTIIVDDRGDNDYELFGRWTDEE